MNALELHNVTKRFGEKVIANDHVSLTAVSYTHLTLPTTSRV